MTTSKVTTSRHQENLVTSPVKKSSVSSTFPLTTASKPTSVASTSELGLGRGVSSTTDTITRVGQKLSTASLGSSPVHQTSLRTSAHATTDSDGSKRTSLPETSHRQPKTVSEATTNRVSSVLMTTEGVKVENATLSYGFDDRQLTTSEKTEVNATETSTGAIIIASTTTTGNPHDGNHVCSHVHASLFQCFYLHSALAALDG